MAEYWKSTPSYWCKSCSIYVRDTKIERQNHESTAKHQNNIQRTIRKLHKDQEREDREKQRAKDEVARLNKLVGGQPTAGSTSSSINAPSSKRAPSAPAMSSAQQRKAHAEQLAAMGIELPDELKQEVTGVGGWKVVSERVVEQQGSSVGLSLADIKREAEESGKLEPEVEGLAQGVHKRKADGDDELENGDRSKRKAWGSSIKTYPGSKGASNNGDLDALLNGFSQGKEQTVKTEAPEDLTAIKNEDSTDMKKEDAEKESSMTEIPPIVVFKKRKVKGRASAQHDDP